MTKVTFCASDTASIKAKCSVHQRESFSFHRGMAGLVEDDGLGFIYLSRLNAIKF